MRRFCSAPGVAVPIAAQRDAWDRVRERIQYTGYVTLMVGAILLLVGTGTSWLRSIIGITAVVAESQWAITSTLLLNIALILFGWPDMQAETTRWKVEIPHKLTSKQAELMRELDLAADQDRKSVV